MPKLPPLDHAMFWLTLAGVVGGIGAIPLAIGASEAIPDHADLGSNALIRIGLVVEFVAIVCVARAVRLKIVQHRADKPEKAELRSEERRVGKECRL